MSRRKKEGYAKLNLDDEDGFTSDENDALLPASATHRRRGESPGSAGKKKRTIKRKVYYDEWHLTENFKETELNSDYDTWGVSTLAQSAATSCGNIDLKHEARTACFCLRWLPTYDVANNLMPDISAGLTVGVVLVAQGVAYGLLTGLPAYYGLYASIPPAFVYALLGTSRQMHIGPFALVSLLVAEGCADGGYDPDVDLTAYVDAVMTMSLMCSFIYLSMWVLRLGFLVEILSDPTMSAMTTASAFLICTSQMRHFFGLTGIQRASFLETWGSIITKLPETNFMCVFIALASLAMQFGIAKMNKKMKLSVPVPEQLIVVIVATWFVWQFQLDTACFARTDVAIGEGMPACAEYFTYVPPADDNGTIIVSETVQTDCPLDRCYWDDKHNVRTLGYVPSGLPSLYIPDVSSAPDIMEGAIVVAVVSIALCIATAKTFADKNGYEIDTNQELLALGIANLVGGVFQCYPAASSLSRSALAQTVGAKTQLWNVFCCGIIVVVLLFLVSLLRTLPNAALAAIILIAFKSILGQLGEVKRLWALSKPDCFVWVATFVTCLLFGVKVGIACGVMASIGATLKNSLRPYHALLGRLPNTEVYRDVRRYPDAMQDPGIIAFRFDGPIVFANRDFLKQTLTKIIAEKQTHSLPPDHGDDSDDEADDELNAAAELASDLMAKEPKPIDKLFVSMHAAVEYAHRRERTRKALSQGRAPALHTVILQFTSVNTIDSSGLSTMRKLFTEMKSGSLDVAPQESSTVPGEMSRSMSQLPEAVAIPLGDNAPLQPLHPLCIGMAVVVVGCTGSVRDILYAADMCKRTTPTMNPISVAKAATHWKRTASTSALSDVAEDPLSPTDSRGTPDGSPRANDEHEELQQKQQAPPDLSVSSADFDSALQEKDGKRGAAGGDSDRP